MRSFTLGPADPGTATFRALLWKELREGLKWGVLGLLIVAANVLAAIDSLGPTEALPSDFLILTPALVGILIGLVQTIPESRGDAWGFQIHRPIGPTTLFAAKAVAGLALYGVATIMPFLAGLIWIATPGHHAAPFDRSLALPGLADILCGIVYYCAAMIVGMRDARWFGSRALPLGIGLVCSLAVHESATFLGAVLAAAAGIVLAGVTAWRTFATGGQYSPRRRLGLAALGATISAGFLIASPVVTGVLVATLPMEASVRFATYDIDNDGTIVKVEQSTSSGTVLVTDLAGHALSHQWTLDQHEAQVDLRLTPAPQPSYRETSGAYVGLGGTDGANATTWFFVRRAGLIAGYSLKTRRVVGWLGPAGLSPGSSPPSPRFEGPLGTVSSGHGQLLLSFPGAVYRLTFDSPALETVFTAPPGDRVLDAEGASRTVVSEEGGKRLTRTVTFMPDYDFFAVATTGRICIFYRDAGTDTTVVHVFPRDPQAREYDQVRVSRPTGAIGKPIFVVYPPDDGTAPTSDLPTRPQLVSEYHGPDSLIAHLALPPVKMSGTVPWARPIVSGVMTPPVLRPLGVRLSASAGPEQDFREPTDPYFDEELWSRAQVIIASLLAIILSLTSAGAAFVMGRRAGLSQSGLWLWTVLGAALGPYGLLLMLALIEWPTRIPCPVCGLTRAVPRERCEHCGGTFAQPAPDGTEIFEPMLA